MKVIATIILSMLFVSAQLTYTEDEKKYHSAPGTEIKHLDIKELSKARLKVIDESLKVRMETRWPRYVFGSADPQKGGFDCSGALYYVLRRAGYGDVPRTSSDQYLWVKDKGKLRHVSKKATTLEHRDFRHLKPGDFVFWSGTYKPTDGRKTSITHIGLYLGKHAGYDKPVMICASKGRYFAGHRQDGYGIYDFKVPSEKSKSKIVAYGSLHNY